METQWKSTSASFLEKCITILQINYSPALKIKTLCLHYICRCRAMEFIVKIDQDIAITHTHSGECSAYFLCLEIRYKNNMNTNRDPPNVQRCGHLKHIFNSNPEMQSHKCWAIFFYYVILFLLKILLSYICKLANMLYLIMLIHSVAVINIASVFNVTKIR